MARSASLITLSLIFIGCGDGGLGGNGAPPAHHDMQTGSDLAAPLILCGDVKPTHSGLVRTLFVGPPELPFSLLADGAGAAIEKDDAVVRNGAGEIVLGSSGGLPEPIGHYGYGFALRCGGSLALRRFGWVVGTPPQTWVNVETRVGSYPNLYGAGWTAQGDVSVIDLDQSAPDGALDVQFDVTLNSAVNGSTPALKRLYACFECL